MNARQIRQIVGLMSVVLLSASGVAAAEEFQVTVTNLTRGQTFTPILVASHHEDVRLFTLGQPASPELATLAEEGNVAPLSALLLSNPAVLDVQNSGALLAPGASVTVTVQTRGRFDHVSVAAMLIPTNDAFFALNGVANAEAVSRHYRLADPVPAATAITAYLSALGRDTLVSPGISAGQPVLPARIRALVQSVERGARVFAQRCGHCHRAAAVAPAVRAFPRIEGGRPESLESFLSMHRSRGGARLHFWAEGHRSLRDRDQGAV